MNPAFISTIMAPNFEIKEITSGTRRPIPIPKAQKRAEMLGHPCILGDPRTKGDKIRIGSLTLAFSGARKRAEMLRQPCILGDLQQNQISKPTLGVTMMPLVSQSMGL